MTVPSVDSLTVKFCKSYRVQMARQRASTRSSTRKPAEKLSSLTSEVLRLRLQALSLPIDGSRQQLISRLKAALANNNNRSARAATNRVGKPSRRTRRASTANATASTRASQSAADPPVLSEPESADEDNSMLSDDGASSLDDIMSVRETTNAASFKII